MEFNIFDSMKYPKDTESLCFIDVVEPLVEEVFEVSSGDDDLKTALENALGYAIFEFDISYSMKEAVIGLTESAMFATESGQGHMKLEVPVEKLVPSIEKAPDLELKVLPEHLKYVYLGEGETLPVVISSKLTEDQEKRLIEVIREC